MTGKQDRRGVREGAGDRNRRYAILAAVAGLVLLAYSNSIGAPFLMDNTEMIRDTRIHAVTSEHLYRIFTQRYWEAMGDQLYRPLTTLSYLFNYAVLGNAASPAGYHWLNLILHAGNMLLVYWLGLRIFERATAAALLSAMWGLNPVLTESVTNIVGRADLMAAGGVLAALLAHRNALHASGRKKAAWLAAVAMAVTAGMFSKESAIVAIAAVVLWDLAFESSTPLRARLSGYAAVTVPCLVFLFVRANVLAHLPWTPIVYVDNPMVGADFWTARMTAVKVIGKYFYLLVWPAALSCDYSYNQIPLFGWSLSSWEDWKSVVALAGCLAALVVAVRSWRRDKPSFFFIAFFFAALAPVSNLVILIGTIMGERLIYLPSIGFAGCLVCAVLAIIRRLPAPEPAYRNALGAVLIVITIAFTIRTWDRNSDWLDERRFWESAREAAPGSYKTVLNVAMQRPLVGYENTERSIREVGSALAILDGLPDVSSAATAYRDAGTFYRNIGDGIASREGGLTLSEGGAEHWYGKSLNVLLRCERIELAQQEMARRINAERGKPGLASASAESFRELGRTYMKLRDTRNALAAFERGRLLGADADLLEDLASAYRADGELHKAAVALVGALAVDADRVRLVPQLVELYSAIDPGGCPVSRQGDSPILNLQCPVVHRDICTASGDVIAAYARRGQEWEAAAIRRTAVDELRCAAEALGE